MSQTFNQASTSHKPPTLDVIKEDNPQDDCPGEVDFPIVFSDIEDITLMDTVYSVQGTSLSREEAIDLS